MTKFITPVSMFCTLEQYEKDLKEPLAKLGYSAVLSDAVPLRPLLIVTNAFGHSSAVAMFSNSLGLVSTTEHNRHFIDHYIPELFLALAAMTDAEYGVAGEWWVSKNEGGGFALGGFYRANKPIDQFEAFTNDKGELNGYSCAALEYFRKATKEELLGKTINEQLRKAVNESFLDESFLNMLGIRPNRVDPDEKVPTFVNSPWPTKEISFKDEKPYEPKNGDKVIGFDHEFSSAVQPREGTYIGWDAEEKRHIIKVGPRRVRGYLQVEPVPAEPEITFEPGELVWVKYTRFSKMYYARYYARQNGSKHTVFNNQMQSGGTATVTEIHKFDKRPF